MHSNRRKVVMKWRQTVDKSPTHFKGSGASPSTPSCWNTSPNEESNTFSISGSPGPDGLGSLSLNTPKRRAEMLGESIPSPSKVKLKKISAEINRKINNSQVNLFTLFVSANVYMEIYFNCNSFPEMIADMCFCGSLIREIR